MRFVSKPKPFKFDPNSVPLVGSNQRVLLGTLSTFFPEGEAFFMQAVRHFRDVAEKGTDLDADISAFIGQEAHHSIAHDKLNSRLYDIGFKNVSAIVAFCLGIVYKLSPKLALHVTAILEHYTATLAKQVLDNVYDLTEAEAAIWHQHAVEEWEHRRVSFDVLKLVGSTTCSKLLFPLVSVVFFLTMAVMYVLNGGRWDTKLFIKLARNVPELCRYMRPGFYP